MSSPYTEDVTQAPPTTTKPRGRRASSAKATDDFSREAGRALDQLRDSVRRVMATVPAGGVKAADLGRALGLDYALAWQLHALAGHSDLHMTARAVPKRSAMERFLRAAEPRASADAIQGVRNAYEAFEQVVTEHAGDRESFDAMLTLRRPEDAAGLRRARRAFHRASAAAWGVSSRCTINTAVFRQRPTGELDSLGLYGYIGLQRLHADAVVSLSTSGWVKRAPSDMPPGNMEQVELIEEACSHPLPCIEQAVSADGRHRDLLEVDGFGKRAETQAFVRGTRLAMPVGEVAPPYFNGQGIGVSAELTLIDLLIPSAWPRGGTVQGWITSELGDVTNPNSRHRLPFEGAGQYLGTSLSALHSPAAPQYADLLQAEIERMGWGDTEFAIYRCEVQYPMLHSVVYLRVD